MIFLILCLFFSLVSASEYFLEENSDLLTFSGDLNQYSLQALDYINRFDGEGFEQEYCGIRFSNLFIKSEDFEFISSLRNASWITIFELFNVQFRDESICRQLRENFSIILDNGRQLDEYKDDKKSEEEVGMEIDWMK